MACWGVDGAAGRRGWLSIIATPPPAACLASPHSPPRTADTHPRHASPSPRTSPQVGQKDPAATVQLVDLQLNMLRSAIASLGGSVEVLSVGGGKCELKYTGPAAIAKGISAAIKDRFPDISEVVFT